MALPFAFLLGLLVVVGHREMGGALPGECNFDDHAWTVGFLLVPWLLAMLASRFTVRSLVTGRPSVVPPRALLRLSAVGTPLALHALFAFGAYNDCIDRLAPTSHTLRIVLALAPLYLIELPRMAMATMAGGLLEVSMQDQQPRVVMRALLPGWRDIWPVIRLRLGWPILTVLPALLLGACMDVLQLHRLSYVFVLVTSAGMTIGTILFLVLAAVVLPSWFRVSFGATSQLPEPTGTVLRQTAKLLGFSPKRVFLLPTGMRAINAMMVGPLPVGRLLCLTDGLISTLDNSSLTGVLAHEVGHARMGHPGLLMVLAVVVPLMMLSPLRLLDVEEVDVTLQAVAIVAIMLALWFGLRTLARRFEHEADVSSVKALGAAPCSRALMTVSRLAMPQPRSLRGRLASMHPDEQKRLLLMRRYESEPAFRERFDRQTRRLRRFIGLVLVVAITVGGWFWQADWAYERVLVRYHSGDYVGAQAALAEVGERPERWRTSLARVDEELGAALELAPTSRDWATAEAQLMPAAWQRGEQVLLADGPVAARRWFALGLSVLAEPTATEYAIYDFCEAAKDGNIEVMDRLASIIRRNGVPPGLEEVFRGY